MPVPGPIGCDVPGATRWARAAHVWQRMLCADRILLATHVRPDGDAVGSLVALGLMLRGNGRRAAMLGRPDACGPAGFLEGCAAMSTADELVGQEFDLLVALDCASRDRLPEPAAGLAGHIPLINIDHHATNTRFGLLNWVEPEAAATAELVAVLARVAGWPVEPAVAEALWVALVTDSGRFAYESTRAETLRTAAALLETGNIRLPLISERLFGSLPRRVFELRRRLLSSIEFLCGDRVILAILTREDFEQTGCTTADLEEILDWPRSVAGVEAVCLLYETAHADPTRLSVRTRAPLDAAALCTSFGGGGHARAAGANVPLPLSDACVALRRRLSEWCDGPTVRR